MANKNITNKDLRMNKLQLFSHNPGYQTPQTFAGRINEIKALEEEMNDKAPRIIILSDMLGSGKSFLIDMALLHSGIPTKVKPIVIRKIDESNLMSPQLPFIIIDDIDIRNTYELIETKLEKVNKLLKKNQKPVFLIGDYTLRNNEVVSMVSNIQNCKQIKMEPLSKELLIDALNKRATKELKKTIELGLFEPDILNYLIPNTEPKVATFREILTYLNNIVEKLPPNTEKCIISQNEIHAWLEKEISHFPNKETKIFHSFLINYIRQNYSPEKEMKAIETSKFRELCPIQGINTDAEYEEKILKPFAEKGILKSFGIPFSKDTKFSSRYASPYLPAVKTFLEAKFGGD